MVKVKLGKATKKGRYRSAMANMERDIIRYLILIFIILGVFTVIEVDQSIQQIIFTVIGILFLGAILSGLLGFFLEKLTGRMFKNYELRIKVFGFKFSLTIFFIVVLLLTLLVRFWPYIKDYLNFVSI